MTNSSETNSTGNQAGTTEEQAFPLFYKQPEALTPERHGDLRFDSNVGFGFAKNAHVVPLNINELAAAARHYPIVFIGETSPLPVAILGLRPNQNLFVDDNGSWKADTYIPSYVRRYPFVFVTNSEQSQFSLCIDRDAPHFMQNSGAALFEDGEASEATRNALEFCRIYQGEIQGTQNVSAAIAEENLLTKNQANINLADGEQISVTDFKVVDEARFNDLSDAKFLTLRKAGAIPPIFCQLISTGNWADLVKMSSAEPQQSE